MKTLDVLWEIIIQARDAAIEKNIWSIDWTVRWFSAGKLQEKIQNFSESEREVLKSIIPIIADDVVYNILRKFHEETDNLSIWIKTMEDLTFTNARDMSDGLHGELFTEDWWIVQYGKFPSVYNEI
jgi:hypothetical protein